MRKLDNEELSRLSVEDFKQADKFQIIMSMY